MKSLISPSAARRLQKDSNNNSLISQIETILKKQEASKPKNLSKLIRIKNIVLKKVING